MLTAMLPWVASMSLALTQMAGSKQQLLCPIGLGTHPEATAAIEDKPAPAQQAQPQQIPLFVSVGSTIHLQMSSKRPITRVDVDKVGIVRVRYKSNDQTTLLVTGVAPGIVHITLTDDRGQTEIHGNGGKGGK